MMRNLIKINKYKGTHNFFESANLNFKCPVILTDHKEDGST